MNPRTIWAVTLAACTALFLAAPLPAQDTPLQATVERDKATGRPTRLVVTGDAPASVWLGRSLYPKSMSNPAKDGDHALVPVGRGPFLESFPVGTSFQGGSFEVALWRRKVDKRDCRTPGGCPTCRAVGYHVEGQLGYRAGKLSGEAVARMDVEVVADGTNGRLAVTGEVKDGEVWVGRSFYPKGVTDAVNGGDHLGILVKNQPISLSWTIDAKFAGGTYEVALWQRKVEAAECKITGCKWCAKLGYHFEGQLGYKSGALVPTLVTTLSASVVYDDSGFPAELVLTARAKNGTAYLGRSVYPAGVKDAAAEGDHKVETVANGEATQKIPLTSRHVGGGYEAALWERKVTKDACKVSGCRMCPLLGYHLEGLLRWKDGKLGPVAKEGDKK
ncbi:MAG: hypothetical protein HYZ53_13430 [Planctomycetes bacterium]|nr:hypothetical protein [Planctomycetota bacterium]